MNTAERRAAGWGAAITLAGVVPVIWQYPVAGIVMAVAGAVMIGGAWARSRMRDSPREGRARLITGVRTFATGAFVTLLVAGAILVVNMVIYGILNDIAKHRD